MPFAWALTRSPWHVVPINLASGFLFEHTLTLYPTNLSRPLFLCCLVLVGSSLRYSLFALFIRQNS